MHFTKEYLPTAIILLIQCARNDDIKQLLKNCSPDFLKQHLWITEQDRKWLNFASYKQLLLYYLCLTNFEFIDSSYVANYKMDNTKEFPLELLMIHLKAIISCFLSYQLIYYENDIKYDNKDYLYNDLDQEFLKYFNPKSLSKNEVGNILHQIIYYYKENKFYYEISFYDRTINKIGIEHYKDYTVKNVEQTPYRFCNSPKEPYLLDEKTGLKFIIGRQIKNIFEKDIIKTNTYDYFIGTHTRILEILTYKNLTSCHWCNPNGNKDRKCINCQNLMDELLHLKNPNIHKENITADNSKKHSYNADRRYFNELINKIKLEDVENLAELRQERRKVLYEFINEVKRNFDDDTVNEVKMLVDRSFSSIIRKGNCKSF